MASAGRGEQVVYEERVVGGRDAVTRYLGYGIVFLVLCILCLVIYALVTGVFAPPAPRTAAEASKVIAETAVKENPGNGRAWAALAQTRFAEGDEAGAWDAIEQGTALVKDHSIIYLRTTELELLIAAGRDDEAYEKAVKYADEEAQYRAKEAADLAARGITIPEGVGDYGETERLYVLKATAEGNVGKFEDAIKTLDFVLTLNDRAADVLALRGWAKLKTGDEAGAKEDFEAALRYIPDYQSAKDGLAALGQPVPEE